MNSTTGIRRPRARQGNHQRLRGTQHPVWHGSHRWPSVPPEWSPSRWDWPTGVCNADGLFEIARRSTQRFLFW